MTGWKPKYKVGDEVCVTLPSLATLPANHKLGFEAKGIVTFVDSTGFYRIKITKVLFDNYFTAGVEVGQILGLHFGHVEGADKRLGVELGDKEQVVFT